MDFKLKNRHRLKSRDIRDLQDELRGSFRDFEFRAGDSVEIADLYEYKLIFVNDVPCFFSFEDKFFFTLVGLDKYKIDIGFVVVDMGAVGFVVNGADIMSPGIVDADDGIKEGGHVWVCDVNHRKPLAVGVALISGVDMVCGGKGKAVRNVHYVGDRLWNFISAKSL